MNFQGNATGPSRPIRRLAVWLVGVGLCAVPAAAQNVTLPREQVEIGEQATPPAETGDVAQPVEPAQGALPQTDDTVKFQLNGIEIVQATVYQPSDFEPIYAEFIGTEITLTQLRAIADAMQRKYRDDGYLATRVIIPPQAITGGVPKLEVFEGKIIYYEIKGEVGEVKKQIARLLDNLITDRPATWGELERYLLLARDLPGISLTGTLRSAGDTAPGGVILVVDAARKAVDGFANLANRNAEATGPFTASGGLALNSNTEYAERLGGVALTTLDPLEQLTGFLSYEQSLGSDGLIVRATGSRSLSEPGDLLDPSNLNSHASIANILFEYPLVRGRVFSLWSRGGFEYIDQKLKTDGNLLFDDQIRVMFAGFRGVWLPPLIGGRTQFDVEFRQGLDQFGARRAGSDFLSRSDAKPDFTLVRVRLQQDVPLFGPVSITGRVQGQFASEPTSSFEEFSLGELTVGRGFEPGSLTGEGGWGAALELRVSDRALIAKELEEYIQNIELYGFFDYGRVYDRNNAIGTEFEDLASAGFGIRITALETLIADFYYAQPVKDALSTSQRRPNGSVRFNVTKFF